MGKKHRKSRLHSFPGEGRPNPNWVRKNAAELLSSFNGMFVHDLVPPLSVINALFKSERVLSSMSQGAKGNPVQLGGDEYGRFVQELRRFLPRLKTHHYPDWVQSEDDFTIFAYELKYGIPSSEHRKVLSQVRRAERARDRILFEGAEGDVSTEADRAILANLAYQEFLEKYER